MNFNPIDTFKEFRTRTKVVLIVLDRSKSIDLRNLAIRSPCTCCWEYHLLSDLGISSLVLLRLSLQLPAYAPNW